MQLFQVAYKWSAYSVVFLLPSEAGIIALVKNRTFDMTIVIGDGNETSISFWKLVFLILSKQQPGSYFVPTFSLFWVLTGANDVSMIQMVDVAVGISG